MVSRGLGQRVISPPVPVEGTRVCSNEYCVHGGKPQPLSEFYPDPRGKDGRSARCVTCARKRSREAYRTRMGKPVAAPLRGTGTNRRSRIILRRSKIIINLTMTRPDPCPVGPYAPYHIMDQIYDPSLQLMVWVCRYCPHRNEKQPMEFTDFD